MKIYSKGKMLEVPSCAPQNIYSTEEQVVGRWIDGRPIYRKTVLCTTGVGDLSISLGVNISAFINVYGYIEDSVNHFFIPINMYAGTDPYFTATFLFADGTLKVRARQNGYANKPAAIVVEYTKTTDQATIELPAALTAAPSQALFTAAPQSAAAVTLDAGIKNEEV